MLLILPFTAGLLILTILAGKSADLIRGNSMNENNL